MLSASMAMRSLRRIASQFPWAAAFADDVRWVTSMSSNVKEETGVPQREQMQYDLCIVGAGPAGLAAGIRFKQVLRSGKYVLIAELFQLEQASIVKASLLVLPG